jgi:uncharacterized membrane-anchored protein YitT (DUF2179 family)
MKKLKSFLILNVGILMIALILHVLMSPNQFAIGGISGLGIVMKSIFPGLSIGFFMLSMNVILLLIGFLTIGFGFGFKTIYASLILGGYLIALERVVPITAPLTTQPLLEFFVLLALNALGTALIFSQNASTGGTDIIAKILQRYLKINIGKGLLMADLGVALVAFMFIGTEKGLFAIVGIMISGFSIDYIIGLMEETSEWTIISDRHEQIAEFILNDLERGASYIEAQGIYTGNNQRHIRTVISRQQSHKLRRFIAATSPDAFVSVKRLCKTYGDGFASIHA